MKRKNVFQLLSITVIFCLFSSCGDTTKENGISHKNYAATHKGIVATEWLKEYINDRIAADEKYKGKNITVFGIIQEKDITVFDNPFVVLKGIKGKNNMPHNVVCYFPKHSLEKIQKLKNSSEICIQGICGGYDINGPILEDCIMCND